MLWHSFSEPSISGSGEGRAVSSPVITIEGAELVEEVPADRSRLGQRTPSAQEEQPSTSSGVQIDRASQQSQEVSHGLCVSVKYYCIVLCHFWRGSDFTVVIRPRDWLRRMSPIRPILYQFSLVPFSIAFITCTYCQSQRLNLS